MLRPILERTFAHDSEAFLQGLAFHDGVLYEAAGLYRRSSLRIVNPRNGTVVLANHLNASTPLGSVAGGATLRRPASAYFAEGVTHSRGKLLMLTWKEGSLLEYDAVTLRLRHEHVGFSDQLKRREGWGIASDATRLYVSDGSSTIYVVDPHTLLVLERLPVTGPLPRAAAGLRFKTAPVVLINELEMLPNGLLLFNVWMSEFIGAYDVARRCMIAWINGTGLDARFRSRGACLNGIAYDERGGALVISGKLWPTAHEIRLVPQ
jgi:glutamine cyclotransferase